MESSVAANTSETQSMCTPDSNDSGSAEPEGAQIILTVPEKVDRKVLEGSMFANLLKPTKESTFAEYARTVFVPKVTKELQTAEHVDFVFNTCKKDSLKETTQQMRGTGIQSKVEVQSQAPPDWHSFLRIGKNKTGPFRFLLEQIIMSIETSKIVAAAFEDRVLTLNELNVGTLSLCNHEEADTHVFLHALDLRRHCSIECVMIKTVDTNVVVLAVALFPELNHNEL